MNSHQQEQNGTKNNANLRGAGGSGISNAALAGSRNEQESPIGARKTKISARAPQCPSCLGTIWDSKFELEGYKYKKCRTCGVMTTDPFPDESDLQRFYSAKNEQGSFYSQDMNRWMKLREGIYAGYLKIFAKRTGKSVRGAHTLDIGCFNGASLNVITEQGGTAYGMERQGESTACLQESYPGRIFHRDACEPDQTLSAKFDLITMTDVVEHVRNPIALLSNVSNWLKDGGYIFLTTPNTRSLMARLMGQHWPSYLPVHHVYLFDRNNLSKILDSQGIAILETGTLKKSLSLGYFAFMFSRFRPRFSFVERLLPTSLADISLPFFGGEMFLIGQKRHRRPPT